MDGGKQALYNFCSFRVSVPEFEISPRQLRPNSNSISRVNSSSYDNSNAYAATPIPDLTDTLEGDLIIRLHVHASSWFRPPTDGLTGCLVKMDFVGQK